MKALGYIRVSTEEQAREGVSLEAQERRIQDYCRLYGLELAGVVRDEGVSAGKPLSRRPGGGELLRRVGEGEARAVVAVKLDRLFRSASDALTVVETWQKGKVALHVIDLGGGQQMATGTAIGKLLLTVMAAVAEMERALVSERTKAAMALVAERKHVGGVPYGWQVVEGALVPEPGEQEVVGRMLELRELGGSCKTIASALEGEGLEPRGGGRWNRECVRRVLVREGKRTA